MDKHNDKQPLLGSVIPINSSNQENGDRQPFQEYFDNLAEQVSGVNPAIFRIEQKLDKIISHLGLDDE